MTGPDRPSVLLVEDDADLRGLVVEILEEDGWRVVAMARPDEAIAVLRQSAFDLIITDGYRGSGLPLDGSVCLLELAGDRPVVLFTARQVPRDEAVATGFRDVILKPFDLDEFDERIRRIMER